MNIEGEIAHLEAALVEAKARRAKEQATPVWPPDVRLNADGTVDEIVLVGASGNVVFHIEQMSDEGFWCAFYPPGYGPESEQQELRCWIGSVSGRAKVHFVLPDGVPWKRDPAAAPGTGTAATGAQAQPKARGL